MNQLPPDIFAPVHKGLRKALFDLCVMMGRLEPGEQAQWRTAQQRARDVVRFIEHHTEAEDTLLLPLLEERAPAYFQRMTKAHHHLEDAKAAVHDALEGDGRALYHELCSFTAAHLEHMREEELLHLPVIHIHLSAAELHDFERRAPGIAPAEDRKVMLGYMLDAMSEGESRAFLDKIERVTPAESSEVLLAATRAALRED